MRCCVECRRPKCSDVDLSHNRPIDFVSSQFFTPWFGLVWNILWCIYFVVCLLLDTLYFHGSDVRGYWLVPLFNWTYVISCLTLMAEVTVRTISLINARCSQTGSQASMTIALKLCWVLFNINNTASVVNTILHSVIIKDVVGPSAINKVILTSIYTITNAAIVSKTPVKIFLFYQPFIFIICYFVFSAIYQYYGQDSPFGYYTDWTYPRKSGIVLVTCILAIPLIHLLFFAVHKLRILLHDKYFLHKNGSGNGHKNTSENGTAVKYDRQITTTDVVLDESQDGDLVDVTPDAKDDIGLKSHEITQERDISNIYNSRLFKSESDLRDYRLKNGLYCDFATSSFVVHPRRMSDACHNKSGHLLYNAAISRVIVVKKFPHEDDETEEDMESVTSDCDKDYKESTRSIEDDCPVVL